MRISDWSSDVCSSDLAEFDHIGTAAYQRMHRLDRDVGIRVAGREVRDQRLAALRAQRIEAFLETTHVRDMPSSLAIVKISLSPRPDMLMTIRLHLPRSGARFISYAIACDDVSAGMIPAV